MSRSAHPYRDPPPEIAPLSPASLPDVLEREGLGVALWALWLAGLLAGAIVALIHR